MQDKVFLDTNILIYLYLQEDEHKFQTAQNLLDNHACVSSFQAFSELSNVLLKKHQIATEVIKAYLDNLMFLLDRISVINRPIIDKAMDIKDRYGYSYYDSLILSSAIGSGCTTVFSEDMQHGQLIEGALRILNPFREA